MDNNAAIEVPLKPQVPIFIHHNGRRTYRIQAEHSARSQEAAAFKSALISFLGRIPTSNGSVQQDMSRFLYANVKPTKKKETGAEIASLLFTGFDSNYTLCKDEARFLKTNAHTIGAHFQKHFSHNKPFALVSLGCGPHTSVEFKDVPLIRAIGATKYIAMDSTKEFTVTGTRVMQRREPGISVARLHGDFTKPFDLTELAKDHMIVLSLLGDTIGQHPHIDKQNKFSGVSLPCLLKNLGEATNYNGVLLATLDAEQDASTLETKYGGEIMRSLMETFWHAAKEVAGDRKFDPEALRYFADYDRKTSSVKFSFSAKRQTSLCIEGKRYTIPRGTELVIGCSQKSSPQDISPVCEQAGWLPIPEIEGLSNPNTTRLIGITGKNTILNNTHP